MEKITDSSCGIEEPDEDEVWAIKAYQKKKKEGTLELTEIWDKRKLRLK